RSYYLICLYLFFFSVTPPHLSLLSFPTRRSSDLLFLFLPHNFYLLPDQSGTCGDPVTKHHLPSKFPDPGSQAGNLCFHFRQMFLDRKSTRLNSSHVSISYAVFCLKKKTELNATYK